jgi:hypothetical protein
MRANSTRHIPSSSRRRGPRFGRNQRTLKIDTIMQVQPVPIERFNQSDLPCPVPFLQLLLTKNGLLHQLMVLVPNKRLQAISFGKTFKGLGFVNGHPIPQRARDACIDCTSVAIRKHINGWRLLFADQMIGHVAMLSSGFPAFAGMTNDRSNRANFKLQSDYL